MTSKTVTVWLHKCPSFYIRKSHRWLQWYQDTVILSSHTWRSKRAHTHTGRLSAKAPTNNANLAYLNRNDGANISRLLPTMTVLTDAPPKSHLREWPQMNPTSSTEVSPPVLQFTTPYKGKQMNTDKHAWEHSVEHSSVFDCHPRAMCLKASLEKGYPC